MMNGLYEDPRNRCCCDMHVHMGSYVIAYFGMVVLVLLGVVAGIFSKFFLLVPILCLAVAYGSLLYACHARRPVLYWPYLLTNGVIIGISSVSLLFMCAMFVVMPQFWQRFLNTTTDYDFEWTINHYPRLITFLLLVVLLFVQIVNIWFELVVCSARSALERGIPLPLHSGGPDML